MSRIRLEWVPISMYGLGVLGFDHLQITFEYDGAASQDDWFVIEGARGNGPTPLLQAIGEDGSTTLAQANPFENGAPRTGQDLIDKIGTPWTRGSRGLPILDNANAWETMASYAADFDSEFQYSVLGIPGTARPSSNSTSIVASVLHYVGIDISNHIPFGMRRTSGMHTLLGTRDDDEIETTENFSTLQSGRGSDVLSGTDASERFYGGYDDDLINWNKGYNLIHGGQWLLPYKEDGTDTVDYTGGGHIVIRKSLYKAEHAAPDYVVNVSGGAVDHLYSIERIQWSQSSDTLELEDVEVLEDGMLFRMGAESSPQGDQLQLAALGGGVLIDPTSVSGQLMLQAIGAEPDKASWIEAVETIVATPFNDKVYLDDNLRVVSGGAGDDLIDARLSTAFEGASPQGYDAELLGGDGNDTLVANAGRTLMTGGVGADTFVVSATSSGGATIEIVIDGADSSDHLYIPYAFFNGSNGQFEGSQLMPVRGGIGEPGQIGENHFVSKFDWLTEAQLWHGTDMSQGVITFLGAIEFDYDGSDLLIHLYRGQTIPVDHGSRGIVLEVLTVAGTETVVRVKDFQEGDLGINFYDQGTLIPIQLPDGRFVPHYPNHDGIVATLTGGAWLGPLEARPTALELPPPEAPPAPPLLGSESDDTIAPAGNLAVNVQAKGGNDSVTTGSGADAIDGGPGNDTMTGGGGNDTYIVGSAGDLVTESINGGTDTIFSAIDLTLPGNVEALILSDDAVTGTGNSSANSIGGGAAANLLHGLGGSDTLIGSVGNDTLIGGAGSDQYGYALGDGVDVISDQGLAGDVDVLVLNHGITAADVTFVRPQSGSASDLLLVLSNGGRVLLQGFSNGAAASVDQVRLGDGTTWLRSDLDAIAAAAPMEANAAPVAADDLRMALSLAAITFPQSILLANDTDVNGDTLTITGVGGATGCVVTLLPTGEIHIDAPTGYQGLATFTYTVSDGHGGTATATVELATGLGGPSDTPTGSGGNDSMLGQSVDETLLGLGGDDTLDGGGGDDSFDGGSGFDWVSYASAGPIGARFALDNSAQPLGEAAGDTYAGIEGAIGSAYVDAIIASAVSGWLKGEEGADDLIGAGGNDTLEGGNGMDGLIGNAGNDTLIGGEDIDSLHGNDGSDLLDGATGETALVADELTGGPGDDTYIVHGAESLLEVAGQGNDLLRARSSFQLAAGVSIETLRAESAAVLSLAGNELAQLIANDPGAAAQLIGGGGADTITGGAGGELLHGDFAGGTGPGVAAGDLIQAGAGDDTVRGEAGNDTLQGGDGSDQLYGGLDADTIDGGLGADLLAGEDGGDTLSGGGENDTLIGGGGIDVLTAGDGNDLVDGTTAETTSAGDQLAGGLGDDTYVVGGPDTVVETAGQGNDLLRATATYQLAAGVAIETLRAEGIAVASLTGNDLAQLIANDPGATASLIGGGGADTLTGGAGGEVLHGDFAGGTGPGVAGTDLIQAGGGNDTAFGEAGNDTIYGAGGSDQLSGGDGDDLANGDDGDDVVQGGNGNDTLSGVAGNDSVRGEAGNDVLWGGTGNDTLIGGLGTDALNGVDGADRLDGVTDETTVAIDTLTGGLGNDTYLVNGADVVAEAASGGVDLVSARATYILTAAAEIEQLSADVANITVTGNELSQTLGTTLTTVAKLRGGGGNDTIIGSSAGADALHGDFAGGTGPGAAGNDSILGGGGNDSLYGESGNDTLLGQDGSDRIQAGAGNDSAEGGIGNDIVYGEAGDDVLLGQAGHDTLYGGTNNDSLDGGDGFDTLRGEAGNDTLTGGASTDSFDFSSGFGRDTITDLASGDLINLQAFATSYASLVFTNVGANVEISATVFGGTSNVIVVANQSGPLDAGYFLL